MTTFISRSSSGYLALSTMSQQKSERLLRKLGAEVQQSMWRPGIDGEMGSCDLPMNEARIGGWGDWVGRTDSDSGRAMDGAQAFECIVGENGAVVTEQANFRGR